MITKEDVKAWLDQPCTKLFYSWIKKDRKELYEIGCSKSFEGFQSANKDEFVTRIFGTCKGLDRVTDKLDECTEEAKQELVAPVKEEDSAIEEMLKFVSGEAND